MNEIRKCANDLHTYITANKHSFMGYGSEFRPKRLLETLLLHHRSWPSLSLQLSKGSSWPLSPISEEDRKTKNLEFIARGNHKSAITHHNVLRSIIDKEVKQGWMIPIPLHYVNEIPNSELAPVGIDNKQYKLQADGTKVPKYRLTHDQTFEASVGKSVNNRTQRNKLDPLFYGGCLSRLLHYIVSLRHYLPNTKILCGKSDIKSAYRRITLNGNTAAQCSMMCDQFGLLSLRLTFGGSPCSNEWCVFGEICTDLANDLLHSKDWDHTSLYSPHASKLPPPSYLPDDFPYTQAEDLDVDIPFDPSGRIDDFIDDGIAVVPDLDRNKDRGVAAILLAIHTLCRPLDPNEPIQREDCLSLEKLEEEGMMSETVIILGWKVNTRSLTLSLPSKKYNQWTQDLKEVIQTKRTSLKQLEIIIGRLNHTATACPFMRYFLNRLRHNLEAWKKVSKSKTSQNYLTHSSLSDLKLWHNCFLPAVHLGISLNLITYRRPSIICWSDACPMGLGGYNHYGLAWRLKIPDKFQKRVQNKNNSLEFLASIITVWFTILNHQAPPNSCFLSLGDNTSAVGWLHKANIDETKNYPLHSAARHYATILISNHCCLYSQHIKGINNKVADTLSRLHDYSPESLTTFISQHYPSQVPPTFHLAPLPQEISSWVTSWLQSIKEPTESGKEQKEKKTEFGRDGANTVASSAMNKTCSLPIYPQDSEPDSSAPSQPPLEEDYFPDLMKNLWEQAQSKRPWQNWVRSLGQTWGTTPPMATMEEEFIHTSHVSFEE